MRKASLVSCAFAALLPLLKPAAAGACTCPLPVPCDADFVFIGWVEDVTYEGAPFIQTVRVRFAVDYLFQGSFQPDEIEVGSGASPGSCGAFGLVQPGQPWLIYAYGDQEPLSATSCSRTRQLDDPYDLDAVIAQVTGCTTNPSPATAAQ